MWMVRPATAADQADNPGNEVAHQKEAGYDQGNQPGFGNDGGNNGGEPVAGIRPEVCGNLHDKIQPQLGADQTCDGISAKKTQGYGN